MAFARKTAARMKKLFCWIPAFAGMTMMMIALCAHAKADVLDAGSLGGVPVLHEGRIKPLDSFARISLAGLEAEGKSATELLAMALFTPADALSEKLFAVRSPALRSMLKLPDENIKTRYSYTRITPALRAYSELLAQLSEKPANQYTAHERELWQLYKQVDRLTQLTAAMSLLLPIEMPLSPELQQRFEMQLSGAPIDYLQLSRYQPAMQQSLREIVAKKGADIDAYSEAEKELALVSMQIAQLASTGDGNHLLRVVPSEWNTTQHEWLSPWEALNSGKLSQASSDLLAHWRTAAAAYQREDAAAWGAAITNISNALSAQPEVSRSALWLERAYYGVDIKWLAIGLYALCLLFWAVGSQVTARAALLAAILMHAALVMSRILILQRPPVATLYESVLFVALVSALFGLALARRGERSVPLGIPLGAALAASLLAISGIYAGEGDPMSMPMAVLNTNFWLATHVLMITSGYGASLMAGVMAHVALWNPARIRASSLQFITLVALLLTSFGTMLGGVWADQSWGRFWGWDPKENGALLLTLWLVWLLHSRMTQHMQHNGFAALLALTTVVVAISWFGVNLLGVGLHSYGFTSAAAIGLWAFCAIECCLIGALYIRTRLTTKEETV